MSELRSESHDVVQAVCEQADTWRASVAQAKTDRDLLVDAIREAQNAGVPELRIAREAKLHRMSMRRWLGKVKR